MDNNTALFLAILSMDAYYRNPNGTLNTSAFLGVSGLQSNELGTATLADQQSNGNTAFFADAWIWNEQYIIAYRGTVSQQFFGEAYNGFGLGAGSPNGGQAQEAIQFYQKVAKDNPDFDGNYQGANILLTGHSLGGGLAGFVGDIYGQQAAIFDNEPYEAAAQMAYSQATTLVTDSLTGNVRTDANGNPIFANPAFKNLIYGSETPFKPNESGVTSFAVQGEVLEDLGLRSGQSNQTQYLDPYGTPPGGAPVQAVELHSMSLLVDLLWAQDNSETAWQRAGTSLLDALFNNRVAGAIVSGETSDTMMTEIAYSAIPDGYQPFGNTAIQSLFTDADTIGQTQSAGDFVGLLAPPPKAPSSGGGAAISSSTGLSVADALMEIAVQYAGDQAVAEGNNPALANTNPALATGALSLGSGVLSINLDPKNWTTSFKQGAASSTTPTVVGLGDLANAVFANFASIYGASGSTRLWIESVAEGNATFAKQLDEITQVDIALNAGDLSAGTLPAANDGSPGGAFLIGQLGTGTITGSAQGNDIIVGGATINTGTGNDTILTSKTTKINSDGGKNLVLADAQGGDDDTFGYASSSGSDLIIGDAQGGDTFTFDNASQAAFTVVWGGAGNDTFDINASGSSDVNALLLNMSGITAANITSLDMSELESYVDTHYAGDVSQGYGGQISEPPPTIVILNPTSTDTIEYNGKALSSGEVTTSSAGGTSAPAGLPGADYGSAFAEAYALSAPYGFVMGYLPNEGEFVPDGATNIGGLPVSNNAWQLATTSESISTLSSGSTDYSYVGLTFGSTQSPIATLEATAGSGGAGELDIINFAPNDFGIGLNAGTGVSAETETTTTTDYAVTAWQQVGFDSLAEQLPGLEAKFSGDFVPAAGFTGDYFGLQPATLGAVISTGSVTYSSGGNLFNPGEFATGPSLDISDFLSGTGSSDPTNVSVAFFAANQALLDGQYYGFTVLDTAANVSSALDALNSDSKLTGITLTDSGIPTLTLTVAQAFGDTTALDEITNPSYGIAIVDTCANVSQNFDALSADPAVTSITLTDAATASLTLTAAQALEDTVALGKITNSTYTIAVVDTAENVSFVINALNSDSAVTAITLTDSGTPTLTLTVAQTLGDTMALSEITNADYGISVEDTAANILANASALSADAQVAGTVVVDSTANVLNNAAALNADAQVSSITVVDTVANIFANLSALQSDAQVTSLVVVDTAANILDNASAIAGVADVTGIGVVDTAADVSANIDALNADTSINSIVLTDNGTPTLTLTAAQVLGDTNAFERIANTYAVDVVDTATDVAANIDGLSQVPGLTQITLTDTGTPTLTVTAAQAISDATVIAMITNPGVQLVVSDTAADVTAELDPLNADPAINGIVLTDAGTPTLTLTAAQALGDTTALGKVENADTEIAISDTAADVSSAIDTLDADDKIGSITLTDDGTPILNLSAAQTLTDTAALGEITNASYEIEVDDSAANILADNAAFAANPHFASASIVDSAANVVAQEAEILADVQVGAVVVADTAANASANIDALNADAELSAIVLTDSGVPTLTLTVAQALDDGRALEGIANTNWAIALSDTAANVAANIDILNGDAAVSSIDLTDSGTPTLQLSASQAVADTAALSEIINQNYGIVIADSAADVSANIDALETVPHLASISLTGGFGPPTLSLTASQVANDAAVLAKITGDYTISVTDTAANVLAYQGALGDNPQVTSVTVVDTAANIVANAEALQADTQITSLTVVDDVADVLGDSADFASLSALSIDVVDTAANVLNNATVLYAMPQISSITVVDSAANIGANIAGIADDYQIYTLQFTDSGTPVVPITVSDLSSEWVLYESETNYTIGIVDTAANVSANIDQFYYFPITSITLTDSGVPTLALSVDQVINDGSFLSEITNSTYAVSITDSAATVSANFDLLAALANLSSITLTDGGTPPLTLSAAQALDDTAVLNKITGNYTIAVSDTAANILANASPLQADSSISSVAVIDSAANILANASALTADPQITCVTVVDSAANVLANSSALADSSVVSAIDVADTAADISANIDALNGLSNLSSITVTDFGSLTLTVAQTLYDTSALSAISSAFSIDVSDTAANIANNLTALTADSHVVSLVVVDTFANYVANQSVFDNSTLPVQFNQLDIPPELKFASLAEVSDVAAQTIAGAVVPIGTAAVVGQTVTLTDNGTTLGTATVAADGTFTASVTLPTEGANSIVATVTDSLGNTGSSAPLVDTLASSDVGDTLIGTAGGATLDGSDIPGLVAAYFLDNVTVDLVTGTAIVNTLSAGDTLIDVTAGLVAGNEDTLIGGANDVLSAAGTNDTLIAGSGISTLSSSGSSNSLFGGSGSQTLSSSGSSDTLVAGSGSDVLESSGTDNQLFAGAGLDTLISTGTNDTLFGGANGGTLDATSGNQAMAFYSQNDVTIDLLAGTASVNGSGVSDMLLGISNVGVSGGYDSVTGDNGTDTLFSEGEDNTLAAGSGADVLSTIGTGDTLIAGSGGDTLTTDGTNDSLIGGSGFDTLSSTDDGYENILIAGTGSNVLSSSGEQDMLIGGGGADTLTSTGYDNTLTAGSGDNVLASSGSFDTLTGGSGNDTLIAEGSNETLIGGSGTSTLVSNASGNVLIAGAGLSIASYAVDNVDVDITTGTATLNGSYFSDSLSGITAAIVSGSDDTVIGDNGTDTLTAAGADDTLIGGDGTDTLVSNAGGNTLEAGSGTTIALYTADDVTVDLTAGTASVNGGTTGDALVGITAATVSGSSDAIIGGAGAETLASSGAGNTLIAGSGNDYLTDSGTGGFYQFGAGDGTATIVNGTSGISGPSNELEFTGGITDEQLWFVQSNDDLRVDLMGTQSYVTVSDWFSSTINDVQEITAGGLELDSQMSQLMQAMATYSTDNPGFDPASPSNTQVPNDPTLQSELAAAWHH